MDSGVVSERFNPVRLIFEFHERQKAIVDLEAFGQLLREADSPLAELALSSRALNSL